MSFLPEARVIDTFEPFTYLKKNVGFVPGLFRAQTLVPRVIDAQTGITAAVLLEEGALTRVQRELILLSLASARENTYCVTSHSQTLRSMGYPEGDLTRIVRDYQTAGLAPADRALLDFTLTLGCDPTFIMRKDIETLRHEGFTDAQILEAVLVTSLAGFLCTLSTGLGVSPDSSPAVDTFGTKSAAARAALAERTGPGADGIEQTGGYLPARSLAASEFPPFAFFEEKFGFVPNLFKAQSMRPDVVAAEARAVGSVLLSEDLLSRQRKESILLAVSAANLNTYCVAVHCEMLSAMGVPPETSDRIALNHRDAGLPAVDVALLDFALKLARRPGEFCVDDVAALRSQGFTDEQILEAIVMTGFTCFLNTLQMGLGAEPDFPARKVFRRESATRAPRREDPDADVVGRAIEGDIDAFEELVRRHHSRICRTLVSITGNLQDAEDCTQNTFMKALDHLPEFRGASTFGTWLTRIGINEGLARIRRQKKIESLDDPAFEVGELQPVQVGAWAEPEAVYSRMELHELVNSKIRELPEIHRVVMILRDVEGLSTQETAEALDLEIATVKTRLHRGRMQLREALAPYFVQKKTGEQRA